MVDVRRRLVGPLIRAGQGDAGKDGGRAAHGRWNPAQRGFLPGHGRFETGRWRLPVLA